LPKFWDNKVKMVTEGSSEARITNQKIGKLKTDLESHFMLLQSQQGHITPAMLKNAYLGLPAASQRKRSGSSTQNTTQTILEAFDGFIQTFDQKVKRI
jgi:hypothetical protein